MSNIVLIGFKACGKTTYGVQVAWQLNRTFVDIDQVIEALYYEPLSGRTDHLSCREIYEKQGEAYFRLLERAAVRKARFIREGVIATGGGTVLDFFSYVELKRLGPLVYLKVEREELYQRILKLPELPAYLDPDDIEGSFGRIYEARLPTYEHVADHTIDTKGLTVSEIVAALSALYTQTH